MAEYKSEKKVIPYSDEEIFNAFSDLRKLEKIKAELPKDDKIQDIIYDKDSCSVDVSPIGKIRFNIVERIPNSSIKFEAQQLPFPMHLEIKLNPETADSTDMQVFVEAGLNPFLKSFVSKPLQDILEKMADAMATIPYSEIKD